MNMKKLRTNDRIRYPSGLNKTPGPGASNKRLEKYEKYEILLRI